MNESDNVCIKSMVCGAVFDKINGMKSSTCLPINEPFESHVYGALTEQNKKRKKKLTSKSEHDICKNEFEKIETRYRNRV